MRACTCRGAAARKRTNSSPFSGSCLESFLVPCPCSTRISITQYPEIAVSQSVTIGWVSQNTATKCVVGETCIMLVRVPFLFCLAHTMCSVLRSRHRNPGCFFYPLSNLYSYELRATMLQDLCAVRDNTRDNYWKARHLRPSQSPRALS